MRQCGLIDSQFLVIRDNCMTYGGAHGLPGMPGRSSDLVVVKCPICKMKIQLDVMEVNPKCPRCGAPLDLAGMEGRGGAAVRCKQCGEVALQQLDGSYICRNEHSSFPDTSTDVAQKAGGNKEKKGKKRR
jgi:hypothetical protein